MTNTVRGLSPRDDPAKSCAVEVSGANQMVMLIEAKKLAARFLRESFDDLVVDNVGTASVTAYNRFVPHMGVAAEPIRWRTSMTVRLKPEIVRARREHARKLADAEFANPQEDA